MNLTKLFETQAALDEHIMIEHPELRGQDNLDWKILALQVELAECANEWRGFKKWSKDQKPRTWKRINCPSCEKKGFVRGNPPVDPIKGTHALSNHWYYCDDCAGFLVVDKNPLLEEYVDCLHFILSIGLEIGYTEFDEEKMNEYFAQVSEEEQNNITGHFIAINYITSCMLENEIHYEQAFFEILSLGERLGFTWEQIEEGYYAKNKVNHARQESGY